MDPTIEAIGEQLRAKITSKFTASTFLAGFALVLLSEQIGALWQEDAGGTLPWLFAPATGAVAAALVLFVRAVMLLDEMTMPKRFWSMRRPDKSTEPESPYLTDGDIVMLSERMIFFWRRLGIAATMLTGIAIALMLAPFEARNPSTAQDDTFWWVAGCAVAAGAYARWVRLRAAAKHGEQGWHD